MYNLSNALLKGLLPSLFLTLPFMPMAQAQSTNSSNPEIAELESTLKASGENRPEIEKLLKHYSDKNSQKYQAVCYLIQNMKYHTHLNKDLFEDNALKLTMAAADSLYYNLVKGKTLEEIRSKATTDSIGKLRVYVSQLMQKNNLDPFLNTLRISDDSPSLENISSDFLIQHIDHAFEMREKIDLVAQLNFNEFCECMLSNQSIIGRNISRNGKDLYAFFAKYLPEANKTNIPEVVKALNLTIGNFRKILGKYPYAYKQGFEELLFTDVPGWDCFDVTNFETAILNAVGIPTSSEYNVSYKMLQGRHSQCSISENVGKYSVFALEGSTTLPQEKDGPYETYSGWMNIYRKHFSKQQNNPDFLKAANEEIPQELSSPLIEDITALRIETTSIEIPFANKTENNLAYLGTFNSETGITAVTWGKIDKKRKRVLFVNVIPNRIYFPVYYQDNNLKSFGDAFLIRTDTLKKNKFIVQKIVDGKKGKMVDISLISKFPRKPKMLEVAKNLIGTTIWGSNSADFKQRDSLYTLDFELQPYLQDINLNNKNPYKYYRIQAPAEHRNMNLSEVQYLTSKEYNYKNITQPSKLPVLSLKSNQNEETSLIRILEDSLEKISKWPEYDGRMTTAPGAYPNITLRLKEPQVVTHVRIAPLNEDNGITIGDTYALFHWKGGQWQEVGTKKASYNHLYFESLSTNALYWLKNLSRGKEELPFFVDKKGKQNFIYQD